MGSRYCPGSARRPTVAACRGSGATPAAGASLEIRGVLSDAPGIELGRDNFYVVERRGAGVLACRSSRPIQTVDQLAPAFETIHIAVDGLATTQMRLLIDLRQVVGRNDPAFEEAVAPLRRRLFECFAESGLLLKTSVGALQLRRYLTLDGTVATLFSDEADAYAWVAQPPFTEDPGA